MAAQVPTLSSFGWVSEPFEKLDFLIAHFFEADKIQAPIYGDNVSSFQWILEDAGNNVAKAVAQTQSTLITYLRRYYDAASVDVSLRAEDVQNTSSRKIMTVAVVVTQDGRDYQANRLAQLVNGKFQSFVEANNT